MESPLVPASPRHVVVVVSAPRVTAHMKISTHRVYKGCRRGKQDTICRPVFSGRRASMTSTDSRPLWPQVAAALVACQVTVLNGATSGMGGIILTQEEALPTLQLTAQQKTWIVSSVTLAGALGCIAGSYFHKRMGVRWLQMLVGAVALVGSLGCLLVNSFALLMTFRLLVYGGGCLAAGACQIPETSADV